MPDRPLPDRPLKVLLAEDQALLRVGLTRILEAGGFQVVATTASAPELTAALTGPNLDVAILDVRLPPTFTTEGLVAAVEARRCRPGLPVLVLSQYVEPLYAGDLLAGGDGAVGYLLKDRVSDVDAFLESVHRVADGGTVLDPEVIAALVRSTHRRRPPVRERESGRQAHHEHLHQARPPSCPGRQPASPGRPGLATRRDVVCRPRSGCAVASRSRWGSRRREHRPRDEEPGARIRGGPTSGRSWSAGPWNEW
jgi:DNA-binding NarL/FixJ family response regulator